MPFIYSSPSGITLTSAEESILCKVDDFVYQDLTPFKSFGDLHKTIIVELRHCTEARTRKVIYRIDELKKKIAEINKMLGKKQGDSQFLYPLLKYLEGILERMLLEKLDELVVEESMTILGEYLRNDIDGKGPKVILYMDTIRSAGRNTLWLLSEVYVHELHHAWYDHDVTLPVSYFREVEEPLTELGMLFFMEKFDHVEKGILQDALCGVRDKKLGMASCYGFGSYLFDNSSMHSRDWRNALYQAKYNIAPSAQLSEYCAPFRSGMYPVDENQSAGLLWRVLFEAPSVSLLPPSAPTGKTFILSKELRKSIFSFGFDVDKDKWPAIYAALGRTLSVGDRIPVDFYIGNTQFDCMMSVISSKGHPDGVMRVTWQKASAVEAQMAKVYAGLCDHYQKHGATTPPYRIAIDIHIYHLGSCTFAIE